LDFHDHDLEHDLDDLNDVLDRPRRRPALPEPAAAPEGDHPDGPGEPAEDLPYSTWPQALHGPKPYPEWMITDFGALDADLGVLKTGKEADVHLLERAVPGGRSTLMAAKRYRPSQHRLFHRDAGYLEGRRVRRSRETRAMATRTRFGREIIAVQWAGAEFAALGRLWELGATAGGVRVPYPVQLLGTELLLEFIGDADGTAAPRLSGLRPDADELAELWRQVVDAMTALARAGLAHGDLSPYNVLVHRGEVVLIDLPQVVDVVANPQGPAFLARDVRTMTAWFAARGMALDDGNAQELTGRLLADAGLN
jgi:RIO kinase 1